MLTGVYVITDAHKSSGNVFYSPMIRDFVLMCMMVAGKYGDGLLNVFRTVAIEMHTYSLLTCVALVFEVSKFDTLFTHDTFI